MFGFIISSFIVLSFRFVKVSLRLHREASAVHYMIRSGHAPAVCRAEIEDVIRKNVEQPMNGIGLDEVKSEYGMYSTDDEAEQIEIHQECKSETDLQELLRRSTALSFAEDVTFNKVNPSASPPPLMEA